MDSFLSPEEIDSIPAEKLESFLKQRRWYGAKSKKLVEHKAVDVINIESQPVQLAIAIIETLFDDDTKETYQLVVRQQGARAEILNDALDDAEACQSLYEVIRDHKEFDGRAGRVRIRRGSDFQKDHFPISSIQPLSQEQSNSSVVFGDALFLKLFRNIVFGLNPDFEISLFLMRHPIFNHSPNLYAVMEYAGKEEPATLAFVQEYIRATGSALDFATEAVNLYLDNPSLEGIDAFAPSSKQLGELLGELHLALASDEQDPEFAPEPITEEDVSEWRSSINERLEQLEPCFDEGDSMLQHLWKEIAAAFKSLEPVLDPGMKMRIHGDYHLGQILRAGQEWFILDFEGEPSRPLEERRRKMSPLRDVAIMMRSFNYVALSVAVERARPDSEEWRPQRLHANHWESAMRAAFLEGYYSLTDSSRLLPEKRADRQRLLNIFELNRAITELSYDINSRPDWAHICVHTISRILGLGEIESAAQS